MSTPLTPQPHESYLKVRWEDLQEGAVLPAITLLVDYRHAIMHVGAGRDYMPGHHNPEYARAQGLPTVFLNTLFHQSFVDRVMTEWAGPAAFIVRRKLNMIGSICADDEIVGAGKITRVYRSDRNKKLVDLDIEVHTHREIVGRAQTTLMLDQFDFLLA
jgi:acyl dehydratase